MTYRGIEYVKINGYWRAKPGQGTGERSKHRPTRKTKREAREPAVFWECVNEKNGHRCGTKHKTSSSQYAHEKRLNRRAWHHGGRKAQTWVRFKVVDGVGYHNGVGAPRAA